jgi:hypothetical protein
MEKVILKRFLQILITNSLIPPEQFGLRKKHSCVSQLFMLTDIITNNFNLKKYMGLVCIDLEKAFDMCVAIWSSL